MLWLAPFAAFAISFFTSMAGVSGAFLLLPLQMSVLGIAGPMVSATNMVFNLVATPSGVYRYWRERRILWPLCLLVVAGTAPGVIAGTLIRIRYLPDKRHFQIFVGLVLLWIAIRLVLDIWKHAPTTQSKEWQVRIVEFTARRLVFEFQAKKYQCRPAGVFALSLVVGLIGGIYGIGGAAIIAPFLVSIYGLPVHTIAGATLMGTLVTSVVGVSFYQILRVPPDWSLGLAFGIGGMAGMYLGARTQRFVPSILLKVMLALILLGVALPYLLSPVR